MKKTKLTLIAACSLLTSLNADSTDSWISVHYDDEEQKNYQIDLSPTSDYIPEHIAEYQKSIQGTIPLSSEAQRLIADLEARVVELEKQLADEQYKVQQLEKDKITMTDDAGDLQALIAHLNWQVEWQQKQLGIPMLVGWRFHPEHGWLYTDKEVFPYVFRDSDQGWYHFCRDLFQVDNTTWWDQSDRVFFNYETKLWEWWK